MQIIPGGEAGGHGGSASPPLLTLLPKVSRPTVVAGGAISTGAQIAALLTLGADGIIVGSRFLVSPESLYGGARKQVILDANFYSTKRHRAFNEVALWPPGMDGRAISNDIVADALKGEDLETRLKKHDNGRIKSDAGSQYAYTAVDETHTYKSDHGRV